MEYKNKLATFLSANFLYRLGFFLFKYAGTIYFIHLLASDHLVKDVDKEQGKIHFGWVLGLAYLLPLFWSRLITSTNHQIKAAWIGIVLLICAYISFGFQFDWRFSGLLFGLGFGLINPNFKAIFGSSLKGRTSNNDIAFTKLTISTNMAAALAAFLVYFFYNPTVKSFYPNGVAHLFSIIVLAMVVFTILWWFCTRNISNDDSTLIVRLSEKKLTEPVDEHYPFSRFITVIFVIILATIFWVGYEMRSISLNEAAREHLCANN